MPAPLVVGMHGLAHLFEIIPTYVRSAPPTIAAPAFEVERVDPTVAARLRDTGATLPVPLGVLEAGHRIETADARFSLEVVSVVEADDTPTLVLRARAGSLTMLMPGRLDRAALGDLLARLCPAGESSCPSLRADVLHVLPSCEAAPAELLDAVEPGVVVVHRSERTCDAASASVARAQARGAAVVVVDTFTTHPRPSVSLVTELSSEPGLRVYRSWESEPILRWRREDARR